MRNIFMFGLGCFALLCTVTFWRESGATEWKRTIKAFLSRNWLVWVGVLVVFLSLFYWNSQFVFQLFA